VSRRRAAFGGFVDLVSEVNRMRALGRTGRDPAHGDDESREYSTAWVPTADVFARPDALMIRIELPGMAPDEIDIAYAAGVLTVSGERQTELGAEDATFYVRERLRGSFRRTMTLPEGTPASAITAEFSAGLVEITVRDAGREAQTRIELQDRSSRPAQRRLG
jgi:HSP20 family protein